MKRMNSLSLIMVGLLVIGLLTWTTPAASQDTPGVWKLAGSMATARRFGGDARLRDGRILAVGGTNTTGVDGTASVFYATAEIYDPATATWTAANSLTTGGRALFYVAGLPNWNILISGGWNGSVALSSAEVYDQDTFTFSATGSMKMARREHRAVTLFDGRVLITGGFNSAGTPTATAEIYDPVAGTFSYTKGNMTVARAAHRMNTVSDGKVLITGGFGVGGTALATAELFDPAKGTFSSVGVGSLAHARARHSATQLPTGEIFLAGGNGGGGVLGSTEIYDPDSKTFRAGPTLNQARQTHSAQVLPNGLVLISGGNNNSSGDWDIQTGFLSSCELYDPATNKIKTTGSKINAASAGLPYPLWTGKFMYAGGGTNETELYTPEMPGTLETWVPGGNMVTARTEALWSTLDDGTVLVTGGLDSAGNPLASAEVYDYLTQAFTTTTGPMSTARQQHRMVQLYTGKVLVTGGRPDATGSPNSLNSAELYDPANKTFTLLTATMLRYRRLHRSTELANGKILITGGLGGTSNTQNNVFTLAEIYDPDLTKQTFTQTTGDMVTPRRSHQAILLRTGKVLIVGGNGTSGTLLNSAELYDPDTDTFTATSNTMSVARAPFLTMLPDGKVLVSNGSDVTGTPIGALEIYDPATDKFTLAANELAARDGNRVTRLPGGKILLVGGKTTSANTSVTDSAELYSHLIKTVISTDNLITGRRNFVLSNLADGRILVAGGVDASSTVLPSTELYTPLIADEVDTTITSGPNAVTGNTSATFTFTSNPAGGTFKCSLDNAAFAACTSPKSYSSLVTGSHRFQVYATDALGNVDPTPATYDWRVNTTAIEVTPGDGLTSSGFQGGPFTPASKSYTIKNIGSDTVGWTASKTKDWVTLSNTAGTLGAGNSITITVQINSQANALSPANYGDTISFTNTTNGNGNTSRVVDLTVYQCPTPGIPSSPSPSDGATAVSIKPTLSWAPSSGADSYDVYFGTSSNPPFVKNTTVPSYSVSGLKDNTKYYWKIVAKNNCGNSTPGPIWSFKTVAVSLPDLMETSVSNPPSGPLGQGSSFAVTDTVKNQGDVAAGASTTRYYLSADAGKGIRDILLTGSRAVPALPVGATSKGTATVKIPAGAAAGTYYLLACSDDTGLVPETNEKNNCIASTSTVVVSLPDLMETSVSNPPSGPLSQGSSFAVTDTVKNQGDVPAGASTTRYYLSTGTTKGTGDILLTGSRAVPALPVGGSPSKGMVTVKIPTGAAAGTYYLLACANDMRVVPETDETNNCIASKTTVSVSRPDLVELFVSDPPQWPLAQGSIFAVTDMVQNQGNVAAGASTTRYYLSEDKAKGGADILLTGSRVVPALQAGATSTGKATVTIPAGVGAGAYHLLACADDMEKVPETNEANNCIASQTTVLVSLPDLVEVSVSNPPSGPLGQGNSFAVTDTVKNQGDVPAGASTTRYYLSTGTTKGTGDILLTGSRAVPALPVGGSPSKGTVTVKIPAGAAAGAYHLLACADDMGKVPETDEANNCIASDSTVAVSLPDLMETSVSNPPSGPLGQGSSFAVTDTVQNQGNVAAIASATRYYLSEDAAKGTGDILLTGGRVVPALQAGATSTGKTTVTIPAGVGAGAYYLLACSDDKEVVPETNEINNCTASGTTVLVSRPDLVELFVSNPPQGPLMLGNSFSVTDTVKNQGNVAAIASATRYYLSEDAAKRTGDILLTGSRAVPALQAGGPPSMGTVTVKIPAGTTAGTYYLLACADDTELVSETDENNNCTASGSKVVVSRPDLAELFVSDPPSGPLTQGNSFTVIDMVQNQGNVVAGASTTRYYLSVETVKEGGDILLTGSRAVPALQAGAMSTGKAMVTIPKGVAAGTYYLLACADDPGLVPETDEANNCIASDNTVEVFP